MMKQLECVLGVDMGTGGARVGIFDLKGNPIVFCEESYPLYTPASGLENKIPMNGRMPSVRHLKRPLPKVALIRLISGG